MEESVSLRYPTRQNLELSAVLSELNTDTILTIQDVLVPGSRLRGKKANLQRKAGDYVNALFGSVGAEYGRCLSVYQWQKKFRQNGLTIVEQETTQSLVDFDEWITSANLDKNDRIRLRAMLIQAPQPVLEFLTPQITGDRIQFRITELTISGKLES